MKTVLAPGAPWPDPNEKRVKKDPLRLASCPVGLDALTPGFKSLLSPERSNLRLPASVRPP